MSGFVGGSSMRKEDLDRAERCAFAWLGQVEYLKARELQRALAEARAQERIPDTLLLLDHPPTYTLGRRGSEKNLLVPRGTLENQGIALHRTDRGGDITFHGPGQLVGYPVLNLKHRHGGASRYLRSLEEVILHTLGGFRVEGRRLEGYTGVWVGEEKIAAIGVKIDVSGITQHGFALNVTTDLTYFDQIIPCGLRGRGVTTLARTLGEDIPLEDIAGRVAAAFGEVFRMSMLEVESTAVWHDGKANQ